jgi:hypothetical protein
VEFLGGEQGQDGSFLTEGAADQGVDGNQQHELGQVLPQTQQRTGRTGSEAGVGAALHVFSIPGHKGGPGALGNAPGPGPGREGGPARAVLG